ncbi:MAG: lamin tail domain-containing protein [Spirochaetes bacterium]|nr:lamin tail domain-containing protein [Spirochaetota bacterium]
MSRRTHIFYRQIIALAFLSSATLPFACRNSPFGETQKSIEEFNIYASDFQAQNDGGAKDALLSVIDGAKATLHCAFSALTLSEVANAVIARARAGVQVKVAFDTDVKDSDAGSIALQASGQFLVVTNPVDTEQSQLLYGNLGTGVMRHNFCLADERYIYISTSPPDEALMRKTPNIALKVGSPQFGLARDFLREINMFSQLLFGGGKARTDYTTKFTALNQVIGVYWGPQEKPLDVLGTGLSEATHTVDFYSTGFQATNTKNTDVDVPQTLLRLESAKGVAVRKYFSTQALFDSSSKAYTLSNPSQYVNASVRVGANILVMDRGTSAAKTYIYTGALRSQGNSADDSVLIELRGKYVANITAAYLDKIGAASLPVSNTGDTASAGAVVVNEINWAGSYSNSLTSDSTDEFLELYNTTAAAINISGWKFACTTNGGVAVNSYFQMPAGAVIPANGFFTVAAKNSGAFPNASYYTTQLSITNSSKECKLTNGKALPASSYSGNAAFTGDAIDVAGDAVTSFDSSGNIMGVNDASNKVRRSMERKQPITAGSSLGSWQSNVNAVAQNTDVDVQFNQKTFGTPGSPTSVLVPSVAINRSLYFATSNTHPNGVAKLTGTNAAANTNAGAVETIVVKATSTSDPTGINLTLTETGNNTSIFTSAATGIHLNFTTGASAGNQLKVASGDVITITYTYASTPYTATAQWFAQNLMINEIGSNCGATTANDYIEIFNPNAQGVNLNGMILYRDSGTASVACTIGPGNYTNQINLSGAISANSYYIAAGNTYTAGGACPVPDFTAVSSVTIDASDCVALVMSGGGPTTPTDDEVIDFVGFGNVANPREGTNTATELGGSNNQCISRNPNGTDTNDNAADFQNETVVPCSPRGANGMLSVVSANANSATTVVVVFNGAPTLAQAQNTSNYCIALTSAGNCSSPQLAISAAVLAGSSVTLTTSAQLAATAYTVYATGITLAASGGALATNTAGFTGFVTPPNVVINEVAAVVAAGAAGDTNGDGTRSSTGDEFVEILNNESFAVDISGWTIKTGSAAPGALQFTVPATTTLPAGGRAVVFGGGTTTGSFGGALTFVSSGLSLTDSPATYYVTLVNAAATTVDQLYYGSTPALVFAGTGESKVRSPEGTGGFVNHGTVSGNANILWSPGVAATSAIPKLLATGTNAGTPAGGASNIAVATNVAIQFNMAMNTAADFNNTNIKLFGNADCASSPVALGSISPSGSLIALLNNGALSYSTTYCVSVGTGMRSANSVALANGVTYTFTTGAPSSSPATNIVISEVGGCRFSSAAGADCNANAGRSNDEFVELYNPTAAPIDISGWFIQRRTAGGGTSCWATLPVTTSIAARGYYLIGGPGYLAANYGGAAVDYASASGTTLTGTSESVVLITSVGSCTGSSNVVDAVSYGTISESPSFLQLPAAVVNPVQGQSYERKACFNSTNDSNATTGMLTGGGHATQGNSEKAGTSAGDWFLRTTMNPQNSVSPIETKSCP